MDHPGTAASTHRQITVDEAQDEVGAYKNARTADSGAAVHRDGTFAVHHPHVADEADQLVGAVRHAMIGPVCELQVMDQMSLAWLQWKRELRLRTNQKTPGRRRSSPHLFLHHADDFNVEVLQELLVLQVKLVPTGVLRRPQPLWPVLVAFDPSSLHFLSHHGHNVWLVFPDHLPKGRYGGGQRALAGDVEILLVSHLHADVAGVDVVLLVSNGNTSFVVLKN